MDTSSFESLIDLLEQEQAIYEELARLLEDEREALVKVAADRLGEIVARKETLALRIKALDESRKLLACRMGKACGYANEQVTVSALCEKAPPEVSGRLRKVAHSLRHVVEHCRELNQYNDRATRRGLDVISGVVKHLIDQADPAGKLYQKSKRPAYGHGAARKGASSLISREA